MHIMTTPFTPVSYTHLCIWTYQRIIYIAHKSLRTIFLDKTFAIGKQHILVILSLSHFIRTHALACSSFIFLMCNLYTFLVYSSIRIDVASYCLFWNEFRKGFRKREFNLLTSFHIAAHSSASVAVVCNRISTQRLLLQIRHDAGQQRAQKLIPHKVCTIKFIRLYILWCTHNVVKYESLVVSPTFGIIDFSGMVAFSCLCFPILFILL